MANKKTLFQQYIEQEQKISQKYSQVSQNKQQIDRDLAAAKAEYERLIQEQLIYDKDHEKRIAELDKKIQELEQQQRRINAEYKALSHGVFPRKIKKEDVVREFNEETMTKYREEVFNPIVEEIEKAKLAYLEAVIKYHECLQEQERMRSEVLAHVGDSFYYKLRTNKIDRRDELEETFLHPEHGWDRWGKSRAIENARQDVAMLKKKYGMDKE